MVCLVLGGLRYIETVKENSAIISYVVFGAERVKVYRDS